MPPGLMWTGIGLIAYGGPMLVSSILTEAEECPGRSFTIKCEGDLKRLGIATGAAMAGTGGLLLMIGNAKRKPVPSVGFSVDRVTWHVRF